MDRVLRLFTEVRAGEGLTAVLLALNVFLILTAYYVLKPVREALILAEGSAELKSYLSAGQVGLLALAVPAYGALAGRMNRRKLINYVTAFFVLCLVVFYGLARADVPLGVVFFLWIGIFNVMIVAQFWSYANDIYTSEEGERLFPIAAFGASSGAVIGAFIAGRLIEPLGIPQLMLVGAGVLLAAVAITNIIDARESGKTNPAGDGDGASNPGGNPQANPDGNPGADGSEGAGGDEESADDVAGLGAALAAQAPESEQEYPDTGQGALIAFLIFFLNWVNTTGGYILDRVVRSVAIEAVSAGQAGGLTVEQFIGKFFSDFFSVVNLAAMVIQLFLVSRIIKYLGMRLSILILPVIALGAYTILAFFPILTAVRWAKTAENATDYSLNNTVRHALFLPCTHEQKFKAKQAIDSFFWRAGDVLSALLVFVGTAIFSWGPGNFAQFNIGLVVIWLTLAVLIGKRYQELVDSGRPPCVDGPQTQEKQAEPAVAGVAA